MVFAFDDPHLDMTFGEIGNGFNVHFSPAALAKKSCFVYNRQFINVKA
jgi:hypothetical protein